MITAITASGHALSRCLRPRTIVATALIALGLRHTALAQVPGMVSFQGVLKDSLGQPLGVDVTLEFRIFDAPTGGNLVDMDGDGAIENVVGQDVKEILATAVLGVVSTQFGPVSPTVFSGQPRFVEVTVISPAPATALTRVPMTTSPAVAEQLYARGTTNVAVSTDAAGNVGIGTDTNTPYFSARLHVNNGQIAVSEPYQDQYVGVFLKGNYNGTGRAAIGSTSSGPARGPFSLVTADGERLTIDAAGNIGIGTSAPSATLDIAGHQGTQGARNFRVLYPEGGDLAGTELSGLTNLFAEGLGLPAQAWTSVYAKQGAASFAGVFNGSVAVLNGHVGIGTTTTAGTLFVHGRDPAIPALHVYSDQSTTQPTAWIRNTQHGAPLVLQVTGDSDGDAGGPHHVVITGDGAVGIGTMNPSQGLHVVGNICATGSIGACSDARFKRETGTLLGALGILDQLRPVRFTWRRDAFPDHKFSAAPQIGFLAQEVEQIVPEVVTCGSDGYYSMDYGRLTPVLTAAMQELHAKHNAEVAELRAKNAELEARLERLEELLAEPDKKGR